MEQRVIWVDYLYLEQKRQSHIWFDSLQWLTIFTEKSHCCSLWKGHKLMQLCKQKDLRYLLLAPHTWCNLNMQFQMSEIMISLPRGTFQIHKVDMKRINLRIYHQLLHKDIKPNQSLPWFLQMYVLLMEYRMRNLLFPFTFNICAKPYEEEPHVYCTKRYKAPYKLVMVLNNFPPFPSLPPLCTMQSSPNLKQTWTGHHLSNN